MHPRFVRFAVGALAAATVVAVLPAGSAAAQEETSADGLPSQVVEQMAAIAAEKAARTPAEQKIDANLLYAVREGTRGTAVRGAPQMRSTVDADGGRIEVDLEATVGPRIEDLIASAGGKVISSHPEYDAVRAELPLAAVTTLAGQPEVRGIRPADEAMTNASERAQSGAAMVGGDSSTASVGAGANEADVTHAAATARTAYGIDGTGVKVCVLSDGIDTIAARQASGDLPAVDVLPGQAGSGDEGTAMLELIHDIAPGAELGFATAFGGIASFASNIVALRADGCDVIVDDITYFAETTLQDGPIAQAITTVRNDGAIYFTSAGNSGNLPDGTSGTWQGDFQDGGPSQSPLSLGLRLHGWGQNATYNAITQVGGPINLQWADPVGGSANDYDLYLLNSAGTAIVASSTNVQNGTQNPAESIGESPAGARIVVTKPVAAASRYLVLYTNRGRLTYGTGGSARGHNVSLDAVSVAATPAAVAIGPGAPTGPFPGVHTSANVSQLYSSDGPTRQYFTPAGAAITPGNFTSTGGVGRNGLDITAADGVTTTTPGFTRFYGTSAAAPNAAAIAALALEGKPSLTPLQLENALGATAIDIEAPGFDPVTGAGIIMAPALLANVGATQRAKLVEANRSVTIQTGDGDAFLEPGETATITQQLRNEGAATATGISATLVSNSPHATVTQGSVTYGNIVAGATGSPNSLPFRIAVSPSCPCGATLPFTLTVTYSGGSQPTLQIPVSLFVGQAGAPQNRPYVGGAVPIPDNDPAGASASIVVPPGGSIANLKMTIGGSSCNATAGSTTVGISHTWVGDLRITLTSPSGTTVSIMDGNGGSGNNLCQVVFDDAAPTSISGISSGSAPFTGTYRPLGALSSFIGEDPAGTWTLKVVDTAAGDTGAIRAFSLQISSASCSAANVAPVGVADAYSTGQGQLLTVPAPGVLGNDTDANGDALAAQLVAGPSNGSLSLSANGSFTYNPAAGFRGTDSFTYRASDGVATSGITTVTLTVNGTPSAVADAYVTPKGQTLTVAAPGVLGNDSDPEGDPLTAVKASDPLHGALTFNANGSFTYVPVPSFAGVDSFTYRATDGTTSSPPQTVTIGVNAPPVAVADAYTGIAGVPLNVGAPGVLGNDTDAEGDALSAVLVTQASNGTVNLAANGSFTYVPGAGFSGSDSFTYRATDAFGQSAPATVTLTINAGNQAPVGSADAYLTAHNTTLQVAAPGVLANDSDPDGNPITAVSASTPTSGTVTLNSNGSFTYVPATGFSGTATFTYRVSDGALQSAPVTVTITVAEPQVGGGAVYVPVTPCRVVDTRLAGGRLGDREIRSYRVRGGGSVFASQGGASGGCAIPAGASAVEASVTAVSPSRSGFFRAYPSDVAMPNATFMNFGTDDITNTGSIPLASSGSTDLRVRNFGGSAHYVIDIQGYFIDPPAAGAVYVPVTPCRVVDTRLAGGRLGDREIRSYDVRGGGATFASQGGRAGGCGIPAGATAVETSVTAVSPARSGFFRAYPAGVSMPNATFMNFAREDITNTGSIPLGAPSQPRDLTVRNFGGAAHYVIDIQGYFIVPPTPGAVYVPVTPCRVVDTRLAGGRLGDREIRSYRVRGGGSVFASQGGASGGCAIPAGASAVEASVTAVSPSRSGFFRAYPSDVAMPNATFMNFGTDDITNTGSIPLASSGSTDLRVRNFGGSAHYVIDIQGYFIASS